MKTKLTLTAALFICTLSAHSGGGSSGTTGGGNHIVRMVDLLPATISFTHMERIDTLFPSYGSGDYQMGLHRIHGIISDDIEAHERGFYAAYDRSRFGTATGRDGVVSQFYVLNRLAGAQIEVEGHAAIRHYNPYSDGLDHGHGDDTSETQLISRGLWGAVVMDGAHLLQRFVRVAATLISQLNFNDDETVIQAQLFSRVTTAFHLLSAAGPPPDNDAAFNIDGRIAQTLWYQVNTEGTEILAMANLALANGSCDVAQYQRVLTRLRAWRMGNRAHIRHLEDDVLGKQLATKENVLASRALVRDYISDSIAPYCDASATTEQVDRQARLLFEE